MLNYILSTINLIAFTLHSNSTKIELIIKSSTIIVKSLSKWNWHSDIQRRINGIEGYGTEDVLLNTLHEDITDFMDEKSVKILFWRSGLYENELLNWEFSKHAIIQDHLSNTKLKKFKLKNSLQKK